MCGCVDLWMCGFVDVRMCGLFLETGVSLGIDWQIYWRAQGSPTGAGGAGGNVEFVNVQSLMLTVRTHFRWSYIRTPCGRQDLRCADL